MIIKDSQRKKLPEGFEESVETMSTKELKMCIVQCEKNIEDMVREMEENEEFQALKNAYKEASAPLRETKQVQRAKIALCLDVLVGRGKL